MKTSFKIPINTALIQREKTQVLFRKFCHLDLQKVVPKIVQKVVPILQNKTKPEL